MTMNKTFFLRKEDREPKWHLIDLKGKILGRAATEIADLLRGKNKVTYTPHTASGDYVVVINASHVVLSGNKMEDKTYITVSGYMGGKRETKAKDLLAKDSTRIITHAVEGMLPKNKLRKFIAKYLRVFPGAEQSHEAQIGL